MPRLFSETLKLRAGNLPSSLDRCTITGGPTGRFNWFCVHRRRIEMAEPAADQVLSGYDELPRNRIANEKLISRKTRAERAKKD